MPPIYGLRRGLRELGYVEGQNIAIEWRWAHGRAERFPELTIELVELKVDVIVAASNPAVRAVQRVTRTTPIVMVFVADPVGNGFVASLARPGGNTTGLSFQATDLVGKGLQLLKEAAAVPSHSRIAVLLDGNDRGRGDEMREAEVAARALGVMLRPLEARTSGDIDDAFATMTRERATAAIVQQSTMMFGHRARIIELAAKYHVPLMCPALEYVEAGCLISYGTNFPDLARRAATYVDKILKGAKPADLPVEQPTKFELAIKLKTAKALGLTIPQSVLGRADQVIE